MKVRRGISLIELLLVMSAASVVLTMSAALIHRVMHAQTKASSIVDVERTALRLSNAFRHDVHQAKRVSDSSADGVLLRLQMPDEQTIEYRSEQRSVRRVVSKGEQILSRELFAFPLSINSAASASDARIVRLLIQSVPDVTFNETRADIAKDTFADSILRAEAMLNRDSR